MKLPPLPTVPEVLRMYGIGTKRSLSQNFLLKESLNNRLVKQIGDITNSTVIEVGPGPGSLTRSLLKMGAKKVIAIEKDERFSFALSSLQEASQGRLHVVSSDILDVDEGEILLRHGLKPGQDNVKIIGNLPFNIATPLVLKWVKLIPEKKGPFIFGSVPMVLMFQKEVAERITAPVGDAYYSRLSVVTQRVCEARMTFEILGKHFFPPPKVSAGVVYLEPRSTPIGVPVKMETLELVCKQVFNMRRKVIGNSIKNLDPERGLELLNEAGINPRLRPQELTVEQWCQLAFCYEKRTR